MQKTPMPIENVCLAYVSILCFQPLLTTTSNSSAEGTSETIVWYPLPIFCCTTPPDHPSQTSVSVHPRWEVDTGLNSSGAARLLLRLTAKPLSSSPEDTQQLSSDPLREALSASTSLLLLTFAHFPCGPPRSAASVGSQARASPIPPSEPAPHAACATETFFAVFFLFFLPSRYFFSFSLSIFENPAFCLL